MVNYICSHCKFKFNANNPRDCPYCGRQNTLEKEKSASELLDDTMGFEE